MMPYVTGDNATDLCSHVDAMADALSAHLAGGRMHCVLASMAATQATFGRRDTDYLHMALAAALLRLAETRAQLDEAIAALVKLAPPF